MWLLDATNKPLVESGPIIPGHRFKDTPAKPAAPSLARMSRWLAYRDGLSDAGAVERPKAAVCRRFPCLTSFPRASSAELGRHESETDKSLFSGHCWTLYWSRKHFPLKAEQMLSCSWCFTWRLSAGETSLLTAFSFVNEQFPRFPLEILHQWGQSKL